MNALIASLYTDEIACQAALTGPNQLEAAQQSDCGYIQHRGILDCSRSPAWSKLTLVSRLLTFNEYVLWVDADVVFMVPDIRPTLAHMIGTIGDIICFNQPRDNCPNSGVVLFKRRQSTFDCLGRLTMSYPMAWDAPWWEQEAFKQDQWRYKSIVSLPADEGVEFAGDKPRGRPQIFHAYGPIDKMAVLRHVLNNRTKGFNIETAGKRH